jgi:lipid A disaccharide synthetase
MVVFYEIPRIAKLELSLFRIKRPRFIALPNIILDRPCVPELIERDGIHPEDLLSRVKEVMEDTPQRATQLADFEELASVLGRSDSISKTAELIVEILGIESREVPAPRF